MERHSIHIAPRASAELVSIHKYIEAESPQNARAVLRRLFAAIDSLEIMPRRYEVHQSSRRAERAVHSMASPPFIVYYRVSDGEKAVHVIAVRHGARRQPKRFR
ncbi:MAG: type II toxin-antitoxin system RelE/ParE family toxin [Phycisphaerae bacterium]|nr:type II toxin-antitoxin system RelE/ParE family toxin [Tepidisphaeraceae bacterium]